MDHMQGAAALSEGAAASEGAAKPEETVKPGDAAKSRNGEKAEGAAKPVDSPQTIEELQLAFDAIPSEAPLQRFRFLWRAFRTAEPINYGYILYRTGLISPVRYWWQFRQGLADVITSGLFILTVMIALIAYFESSFPSLVVNKIVVGNASTSNWKLASGDSSFAITSGACAN
jgi:hypothetical protein